MFWQRIQATFHQLRRGQPGRRFQDLHDARCRDRSTAMMGLRIGSGVLLVVLGVVLSMPPLIPGFLVTAVGLALIASQSRRVSRLLDRLECWLRRLQPSRSE